MRKLALRLLLFAPVVAWYAFPALVLAIGGEFIPVARIVERHAAMEDAVLYGPAYSNPAKPFKLKAVVHRSPRVIALGTSRVMQFRSAMFTDVAQFYNAGGGVESIHELRQFLERIPRGAEPELLIVGLDQWRFNPNSTEFEPQIPDAEESASNILHMAKMKVYQDYWLGKFRLSSLYGVPGGSIRIGLNAIANENGFRNDGSYYYGQYTGTSTRPDDEDVRFEDALTRLETGTKGFEYGSRISPDAVAEVDRFLSACKERQIHVIGFLPPFAHAVYLKLVAMNDKHAYFGKLQPALEAVFAKHGAVLFDFSDLAITGASDIETIDGFHGSETAYVRILLEMLKVDARLRALAASSAFLQDRLAAAGPYLVFDNHEF